jgi:hypothetical protein
MKKRRIAESVLSDEVRFDIISIHPSSGLAQPDTSWRSGVDG